MQLSGLCGTEAGNQFLLDRVANYNYYTELLPVFCYIHSLRLDFFQAKGV